MKAWELAEKIIETKSGGKRTPGSGNKWKKGDVWVGNNLVIEVKQTEKTKMNIQSSWLDSLLKHYPLKDIVLAIFFEERGYIYHLTGWVADESSWKSLTVHEDSLPEYFIYKNNIWEKALLSELRDLEYE